MSYETAARTFQADTLALASGFPVSVLSPGAALLRTDSGWETYGGAEVHGGELPPLPAP